MFTYILTMYILYIYIHTHVWTYIRFNRVHPITRANWLPDWLTDYMSYLNVIKLQNIYQRNNKEIHFLHSIGIFWETNSMNNIDRLPKGNGETVANISIQTQLIYSKRNNFVDSKKVYLYVKYTIDLHVSWFQCLFFCIWYRTIFI